MFRNTQWSNPRALRVTLAALLLGTVLGASGAADSSSDGLTSQSERGWLGIGMQGMTPAIAKAIRSPNDEGVLVDEVLENSPAAQAMLQQGDVIIGFNGTEINTPRDLQVAVASRHGGERATISIWRDGHSRMLDVTLGTQPGQRAASAETRSSSAVLGMTLKPLTDDDRDRLGLADRVQGAVVNQVDPNGRGWESGVRADDVIMSVGNQEVLTPTQAAQDIRAAQRQSKEQIPLVVSREGTTYHLGLIVAG